MLKTVHVEASFKHQGYIYIILLYTQEGKSVYLQKYVKARQALARPTFHINRDGSMHKKCAMEAVYAGISTCVDTGMVCDKINTTIMGMTIKVGELTMYTNRNTSGHTGGS